MTAQTLAGRALRFEVPERVIIDDVDVHAEAGRVLAVSGPSGAGKTTLLSLLGGLLRPSAGEVLLDAAPLRVDELAVPHRVAMVLQGYGLATALTARENVAIALQARGLPRGEVQGRTASALADVGLSEVADHLIEDMSGGQQQRVAVARALASAPEVLLADEPTSELDAENRERILDLLVAQARSGSIVLLASHDPDVVARCDHALELDAGKLVSGTAHPPG